MRTLCFLLLILLCAAGTFAQKGEKKGSEKSIAAGESVKAAAPLELAKAALSAHGGDKFKSMKSLIIRGAAELSASPQQVLPATFAMVLVGEKYRFDLQAVPVVNFQQIFDGQETFYSTRGFSLPPLTRVGLPLLARVEEEKFIVSELPEKLKKKRGFRITSPEGYSTDFIIDEKTNLVKEFETNYQTAKTSVAIDKYREINGVVIYERFSQRLELGQFTAYANFRAREILVDSSVEDDVFSFVR